MPFSPSTKLIGFSPSGDFVDTIIKFGLSEDAWEGYEEFLKALIDKHFIKNICEVGGGANPLFPAVDIEEKGIGYSILDISESELDKAPNNYNKIVADITLPDFDIDKRFGLVFSRMLAEHISDPAQFHKNIFEMLSVDGLAVHFFPTLYTLPFLVNCLLPDRLTEILLNVFAPRDKYQHAKFPPYYRWCRGPLRNQMRRFVNLGYEVVEYRGFFGHSGYYKKLKILNIIHDMKTRYLLSNPNPLFTSYAYVVLRKP